MEYLVTGRQAKAIDTYTIEHTGIPSLVLMERASLTIAEETAQVAAQLKLPAVRIAAVCGSGNNGGDGIAAARILHSRGYDVTIFFAGRRERCHRIVRNSCLLPRICQSRSAMTRTLTHII